MSTFNTAKCFIADFGGSLSLLLIKAIAIPLLLATFWIAKRFQSHSTFLSILSFATTPLPWTRLWCPYVSRGSASNSYKRFAHTFHWQNYFLEMLPSSSLIVRFLAYPVLAGLIFMFNIDRKPHLGGHTNSIYWLRGTRIWFHFLRNA